MHFGNTGGEEERSCFSGTAAAPGTLKFLSWSEQRGWDRRRSQRDVSQPQLHPGTLTEEDNSSPSRIQGVVSSVRLQELMRSMQESFA